MREIKTIIVHCSDVEKPHEVSAIKNYHVNIKGWADIGYHFFIEKHGRHSSDGEIKWCRQLSIPGAHAGYFWNKKSIGICLEGRNRFTKKQFESLYILVKNLMDIFNLDLDCVIPHRRVNSSKSCPNFDLTKWKEDYFNTENITKVIDMEKEMEQPEKIGIEELLEVFDGCYALTEIFILRLKDGYQHEDLVALMTSLATDQRLRDAMDGISKIKGEIKDLDFSEIYQLSQRSIKFGFDIFGLFKK